MTCKILNKKYILSNINNLIKYLIEVKMVERVAQFLGAITPFESERKGNRLG